LKVLCLLLSFSPNLMFQYYVPPSATFKVKLAGVFFILFIFFFFAAVPLSYL